MLLGQLMGKSFNFTTASEIADWKIRSAMDAVDDRDKKKNTFPNFTPTQSVSNSFFIFYSIGFN